ncbi:MAG TPA: response regulator transcription factor, partial [Bryobacteraceae bacterium]|nr:response regulator transcription factor [Bryobacteraceae bacterium]
MVEIAAQLDRILIVDGDARRRRDLHACLFAADFDPAGTERVDEAIALCRAGEFDLVLVRPGAGRLGAAAGQWLRSGIPHPPVLMLAEGEEPERIAEVMEAGVDQCLAGNIREAELVAHMRAVLRRTRISRDSSDSAITIGEIRLDPERRVVARSGVPVHLTLGEFDLLHCLMAQPGIPVAHESLLKAMRGEESARGVACLRVAISRLRRKLNDHVSPRYLLTHSCVGYLFAEAPESGEQS